MMSLGLALSQQHLLITRPLAQSQKLNDCLSREGATVELIPLLEIAFDVAVDTTSAIEATLKKSSTIIFLSQNAVHGFFLHYPSLTNLLHGPHLFAIGSTTADALKHKGFAIHNFEQEQFDSETLLQQPLLENILDQTIVLITGVGGRQLLEKTLRERGAQITRLECYRRFCPPAAQAQLQKVLLKKTITGIIVYSGETLENLCTLTPPEAQEFLYAQPLFVISERIAALAKERGFRTIHIINRADDQRVCDIVKTILGNCA